MDNCLSLAGSTGHVDFVFAIRARHVGKHYINNAIIPMLCRKAGVPAASSSPIKARPAR
jgi:hypothetical protein